MPERRCIVTGESGDTALLIRFVAGPDQAVVADLAESLPGRGCWVEAGRDVMEKAVRGRYFARALKAPVTVAEDLPERVGSMLRARCLSLLGLARRAGEVVTGFEQVAALLRSRPETVAVQAYDAAENSREKLRIVAGPQRGVLDRLFTRDELSQALGQENVVQLAFAPSVRHQTLLRELRRLERYTMEGL